MFENSMIKLSWHKLRLTNFLERKKRQIKDKKLLGTQFTCDNFFLGVLDLERAFFKNWAVWVFFPGVVTVGEAKSLSNSY